MFNQIWYWYYWLHSIILLLSVLSLCAAKAHWVFCVLVFLPFLFYLVKTFLLHIQKNKENPSSATTSQERTHAILLAKKNYQPQCNVLATIADTLMSVVNYIRGVQGWNFPKVHSLHYRDVISQSLIEIWCPYRVHIRASPDMPWNFAVIIVCMGSWAGFDVWKIPHTSL